MGGLRVNLTVANIVVYDSGWLLDARLSFSRTPPANLQAIDCVHLLGI